MIIIVKFLDNHHKNIFDTVVFNNGNVVEQTIEYLIDMHYGKQKKDKVMEVLQYGTNRS